MKKAAEKSAVRWSCVILAVLFFFLASSALTLYGMQQAFGCGADDAAGKQELVRTLYDEKENEIVQMLRRYFASGKSEKIDCPPQLQPEKTNFRFRVIGIDENPVEDNDLPDTMIGSVTFKEIRSIDVGFSDTSADRPVSMGRATVEFALSEPMQADDVFRRALTLVQLGSSLESILWAATVAFSFVTVVFCCLSLRGALREAKRSRGALRLFNALPPDLYMCCVLPALVFFLKLLFSGIRDREILRDYLQTGSGEYRFLLRAACMTGAFALTLIFLMLVVYSLRRGGLRSLISFRRFIGTPFPRSMLVYLVLMQTVKEFAIALYLTREPRWTVLYLLLEKIVTLPVVYRMIRQVRVLTDTTSQFVQGDLSAAASRENDYATMRAHGADVDSIVQRIRDSADEYVQSSRFKAELITNLSHDIKTPLTSIISYAQLLQRDDLTAQEREKYLEVLQRHSGRLQKLVDDLTEVSDAASGNVQVHLTVLDLCSLVQQTAAGFEERLQKQGITLLFRLPQDPVFVTADPRLIQRAADNLMNNICKYARPDSEVQIAVVEGKSSVAAIFRNRSASPLTMSGDALMERFVREDGSRHTDGSGLGLSIANSLMRLQGGKLWLHTEGDMFTAQILFRKS